MKKPPASDPSLQTSYDSIASAAAALNCPVAQLRRAKKQGAPGFRGSRVYPAELLPWLKAQEQTHAAAADGAPLDKEGWEIRKLRLQCEGLELTNKAQAGKMVERTEVDLSWLAHLRRARQFALQWSEDLAPRIAGRPVIECAKLLGEAVAEFLAELRACPYGKGPVLCACGADLSRMLLDNPRRDAEQKPPAPRKKKRR